mmetsp:Transcript_27557/g.64607  ORF Transcript_27557/g.64607 Transcript_27557/m.64607 type:complete len:130 (-) Transcript_27557:2117-2506(-)
MKTKFFRKLLHFTSSCMSDLNWLSMRALKRLSRDPLRRAEEAIVPLSTSVLLLSICLMEELEEIDIGSKEFVTNDEHDDAEDDDDDSSLPVSETTLRLFKRGVFEGITVPIDVTIEDGDGEGAGRFLVL